MEKAARYICNSNNSASSSNGALLLKFRWHLQAKTEEINKVKNFVLIDWRVKISTANEMRMLEKSFFF